MLRSEAHNLFTEKFNKNDDKRTQAPAGVTTYPYGYGC